MRPAASKTRARLRAILSAVVAQFFQSNLVMDALIKHIMDRLAVKPFCTVFENAIARVFPRDTHADEERKEAIREFARRNGWSVKISDPGIRVTFRKLAEAPAS